MRELTIILTDLYGPGPTGRGTPSTVLDALARFGHEWAIPEGWRRWLAQRVGRSDLAHAAPGAVAAAALPSVSHGPVWLATPVHLQAALTHLRMADGALLRAGATDLHELAVDFKRVFGASQLALHPLSPAGCLLTGLAVEGIETSDPARAIGADLAAFLPRGPRSPALRALGAEIEMWLHEHPVNRQRAGRREPVISTLWLWGGAEAIVPRSAQRLPLAFGDDPVLHGLWAACGASIEPLPGEFVTIAGLAGDAVVAIDFSGARSGFAGFEALETGWLQPARTALRMGQLERLTVVAQDRVRQVARRDFWKFWRRARSLEGAPA